ncbi:MAG: hypothetical protein FJY67_05185 [Calditrichaeota bacterium]|nr:hypothetical protein [Calditrichota bacterium]
MGFNLPLGVVPVNKAGSSGKEVGGENCHLRNIRKASAIDKCRCQNPTGNVRESVAALGSVAVAASN